MSYAQHSSSIEAIDHHAIRYPPTQRSIQWTHTARMSPKNTHSHNIDCAIVRKYEIYSDMWCVMVYTSFWFICCQCCGCSCHTVDRNIFAVFIFSRARHVFSLSFLCCCAFFTFVRLFVVEYIINDDYLFYYYMIDFFIRSHILLYVVLNKETINSTFFFWLFCPFCV